MIRILTILLIFSGSYLSAQPYLQLNYNAFANVADCCDGSLQGYHVTIKDTAAGSSFQLHDSVSYYNDSQNRLKRIELFRMLHPDSSLFLTEAINVDHINDSNLNYKTRYSLAGFSFKPDDSTVYEYFSNGNLKLSTVYTFDTGSWKLNSRTRHLHLPGLGDTAVIEEEYDSGSWKKTSYTGIQYNTAGQMTAIHYFNYNDTTKIPSAKYELDYDALGLNDSLTLFFYNTAAQSYIPTLQIYWDFNNDSLVTESGNQSYSIVSGGWQLMSKTVNFFKNKLPVKQYGYEAIGGGNLRQTTYELFSYNASKQSIHEEEYFLTTTGDTVLRDLTRNFYHSTGYPDSSSFLYRNTPTDSLVLRQVKYLYKQATSTTPGIPQLNSRIYPNPTDGNLNLTLEKSPVNQVYYNIFSINGQIVDRGVLPANQRHYQLALPSSNGTYIYYFNIDGKPFSKTVIRK